MAASTAMEALTAELLGDVGKLHDDVKALHELLPTMTKAASDDLHVITGKVGEALQLQAGHYLAAAEKLASVLKGMSEEIDRAAAQAAVTAGESAKLDIRQAVASAAADVVGQSVSTEIAKAVGQVNDAASNLVTQTNAAKQEILGAGRSMSWGFGRILAMVIAGGCISGLVTVGGMQYLHGRGAVDAETAKQAEAGRDFIQLLPQLDAPTKEKLIRMIQKNRAAGQK